MKKIIVGGIYKTDWIGPDSKLIMPDLGDKFIRVMAFDDKVVFYESYDEDGGVITNNLKSKCFYYRITTSAFLKTTIFVRIEPFTEYELGVLRLDLPFRIKNTDISWIKESFATVDEYVFEIAARGYNLENENVIGCNKIILYPMGIRGGTGKGLIFNTVNENGFDIRELFWLANNLQSKYLANDSSLGVGLFRAGIEKQIPSYFINFSEGKFPEADM